MRGRVLAGRVRVEVQDAGPGLPGAGAELGGLASAGAAGRSRAALRAAAGSRSRPGIAERHGGRLAAAPSARGACLVLELPSADWPVAAWDEPGSVR